MGPKIKYMDGGATFTVEEPVTPKELIKTGEVSQGLVVYEVQKMKNVKQNEVLEPEIVYGVVGGDTKG